MVIVTEISENIRFIGSEYRCEDNKIRVKFFQQPHNLAIQFLMSPLIKTIALLTLSNIFMTFAWYAHLKDMRHKPLMIAILVSWGIAFFEYLIQVPANRIGFSVMSVAQLKIMQEIITLSVFVPFAILYLKEPIKLDYFYAGLCMIGAAYFMFRS